MPLGMKIFTIAVIVIVIGSLIIGFFKRFTTRTSKNFFSDAEYGKAGPPENYSQNGMFSKVKGKFGKGGSGGGSSSGSAPSA